MASGDIVLYNNDENWVSLPVKQYSERSAPDFVPRISSDMNQSNLDTTLQATLSPREGSFQPIWRADEKAAFAYGNWNTVDEALYPVRVPNFSPLWNWSTTTPPGTVGAATTFTASIATHSMTYIALREGTTNKLVKVDTAGDAHTITLPAAISGSAAPITGLMFWKNYLFVSGETSSSTYFNLHRYNITANTWQDVSGYGTDWFKIRDSLYHINRSSRIYLGSNLEAAGAATWTSVTDVGPTDQNTDLPDSAVEWNGVAWIGKKSGLYRFDGVSAVRVLEQYPQFLTAHQGALYFVSNGWLCRFNGSLFEKLQYFGYPEDIESICSHQDRLMIVTTGTGSGFNSVQGAYADTFLWRLWSYSGTGFFCEYEMTGVPDVGNNKLAKLVTAVGSLVVLGIDESASAAWNLAVSDDNTRYISTSSVAHLTTSDFTAGFENVNKVIRRVEFDVLNAGASDSVTIKYQYSRDGKTWTSIFSLDPITNLSSSSTSNYVDFHSTVDDNIGKKFRFFLTLNTSSSKASLRSMTVHYSIIPSHRRRVSFTVPLTYTANSTTIVNSKNEPITDYILLNRPLTPSVALGFILSMTDPIDSAVLMLPYRTTLKTALTNYTTTTIVLNGHLPLNTGSYISDDLVEHIAIKSGSDRWEIMRVFTATYGANSTTLVVERQMFKSLGYGAISAGAEVRIAIPISLKILNNSLILDDTTQVADSYGLTQIASDIVLEATEV